ncbi:unnamed protein product [Miscanthus lutarioriparius]|uniref:Serine aminopeptidase S33 domain-containing protein n=1 Tax=Miscanthus lutarioriparius TaxID=422564 RepID=A0A811N7C7_9POAL|nr:unnamed protein product [Miscanthus lutarioriparius]
MQADGDAPAPAVHFWGEHPATEAGFYAAHGAQGEPSYFTTPDAGARRLFTRSWRPRAPERPRALVFMVHGYGNDREERNATMEGKERNERCFRESTWTDDDLLHIIRLKPTTGFNYLEAKLLYRIINSLFCYNDTHERYAHSCVFKKKWLRQRHLPARPPPHAAGGVGGGGVAPMCRISDRIRPPWSLPEILTFVAWFAPTAAIVPTADLIEKSVKVPAKRIIAARNPVRYNGRPRLGTVVELLRATDELAKRLGEVSIPFLVVHGSADEVTDPEVSRALYAAASSKDKSIKIYDGMLHSLLFGEPDENIERVRGDILAWLNEGCTPPATPWHRDIPVE